ncbi:hypothetical protein DL89DRAFT_38813 [Linderina pennispora]|uniref:Uncharacterized protein n=1 Tax=Linderina pennispora TaxID=61395 RepID=A0A1Y1W318_9FUNG|nr:uncharacterized protein DL89DRAFT_38813 [Linderina pennispora]ORX67939.1 hypothetical protein DL89DRAFT_38813 [Linderina pennispora]
MRCSGVGRSALVVAVLVVAVQDGGCGQRAVLLRAEAALAESVIHNIVPVPDLALEPAVARRRRGLVHGHQRALGRRHALGVHQPPGLVLDRRSRRRWRVRVRRAVQLLRGQLSADRVPVVLRLLLPIVLRHRRCIAASRPAVDVITCDSAASDELGSAIEYSPAPSSYTGCSVSYICCPSCMISPSACLSMISPSYAYSPWCPSSSICPPFSCVARIDPASAYSPWAASPCSPAVISTSPMSYCSYSCSYCASSSSPPLPCSTISYVSPVSASLTASAICVAISVSFSSASDVSLPEYTGSCALISDSSPVPSTAASSSPAATSAGAGLFAVN